MGVGCLHEPTVSPEAIAHHKDEGNILFQTFSMGDS